MMSIEIGSAGDSHCSNCPNLRIHIVDFGPYTMEITMCDLLGIRLLDTSSPHEFCPLLGEMVKYDNTA